MFPLAASHSALDHKCLQWTLSCFYLVFERLHFPLSFTGTGLSMMVMCTSKSDMQHPTSHHTHPVVFSPVWLSVLICVSWPLARAGCHFPAVTSPRCPSHLKSCPHSISSLHLLAPRCILVIFCVVCFGSSSVSHHSHLMAGCSLAYRCCFSYCQGLAPQIHTPDPPQAVFWCTSGCNTSYAAVPHT